MSFNVELKSTDKKLKSETLEAMEGRFVFFLQQCLAIFLLPLAVGGKDCRGVTFHRRQLIGRFGSASRESSG